MKSEQLWIEPMKDMIIVRMRGVPTVELLEECQRRLSDLAKETGQFKILHDVLEMDAPSSDVPMAQWRLDTVEPLKFRRAFVVPNTKLAYLGRLAFRDSDYRVFYNDMAAAVRWLVGEEPPP